MWMRDAAQSLRACACSLGVAAKHWGTHHQQHHQQQPFGTSTSSLSPRVHFPTRSRCIRTTRSRHFPDPRRLRVPRAHQRRREAARARGSWSGTVSRRCRSCWCLKLPENGAVPAPQTSLGQRLVSPRRLGDCSRLCSACLSCCGWMDRVPAASGDWNCLPVWTFKATSSLLLKERCARAPRQRAGHDVVERRCAPSARPVRCIAAPSASITYVPRTRTGLPSSGGTLLRN